jgi:hypothetical protein
MKNGDNVHITAYLPVRKETYDRSLNIPPSENSHCCNNARVNFRFLCIKHSVQYIIPHAIVFALNRNCAPVRYTLVFPRNSSPKIVHGVSQSKQLDCRRGNNVLSSSHLYGSGILPYRPPNPLSRVSFCFPLILLPSVL